MTENNDTTDITFGNVPKGRNAMATMGEKGDTKLTWDPRRPEEVQAARLQFDYLVKEKKYAAFRMEASGEKGEQIRTFDAQAERIIMAPPMQGG